MAPPTFDALRPLPDLRLVQITPEEDAILRRGEIGMGRYIAGGVVGSAYGYGIGHAIQGRWREKGWIFTVGDAGSLGLLIYGIATCEEARWTSITENRVTSCSSAPIWLGLGGLIGFRIWEAIDLWATPARHNRRFRQIRQRLQGAGFYAAPTGARSAAAGLTLRF